MADYKKLLTFVSVFSILCVAVIIVLSILYSTKPTTNNNQNVVITTTTISPIPTTTPTPICMTKSCISAANLILNNIDTTVDPCVDFNQFSCGNFIKNRRIPDDSSSTDTFTDLRNNLAFALSDSLEEPISPSDTKATSNAKKYYKSCVNEDDLELNGEKNFLEIVNKELGGCSLTDSLYNPAIEDTYQKIAKCGKSGHKPLFDIFISTNPKLPEKYVLRIQQVGWFLSKKTYADNDTKVIGPYKNLIKTFFTYMNPKAIDVDESVERIFNMERELALYTLDQAQRRNQTYRNLTIRELTDEFKGFPFDNFIIQELYGDLKIKLDDKEPILVEDESYLKNMLKFYTDAVVNKKEDFHNMIIWSYIKGRSNFLPKKYRDAQLEFDKVYSGTRTIAPRTRTCANAINDRMSYAVGRLYVSKNFDENSKKAATEMIENIRKEFKIMLTENEWMDEKSKKAADEKADFIDTKIAYPDFTYNDTYLDYLYRFYDFTETNYISNSFKASKADTKEAFEELRETRDTKEWITGPAIVNAFYSPENNQISFPAGILQAPFYDAKFPNYLNYGGIGSVIGHEITHGFDDQGRKYDKNGVFYEDGEVGLWTDATINNYKEKAKCIEDQYSGYVAQQVNISIRGYQTQGENIADNGGVKESFRAYRRWTEKNGKEPILPGLDYTQEQLFFINYAQVWCLKITDAALKQRIETGVHSPGEFRIKGPTSNSDFFSEAFKCKPNQPNNPTKKCSVW